ncbi:MAG: helix-turn-helix transcriptional regulator, partial [Deltaproteobacteria bacterium]|nr:helix-turn-helix transcriptional regulator [Deltaproteobacteria bacterium]
KPLAWKNKAHVLGIATDLTELEKRTIELKRKHKEQETILDAVPAMIFFKDKNNCLIRVNETFAKETGRSKSELVGMSAFDMTDNRDLAEAYWQDDKEIIKSGVPKRHILEPLISDESRWFETDKIPYIDDNGEVAGVIGFCVEITERLQAEKSLKEKEEMLEAKNRALEELNTALNVLLKKREHDQEAMERRILMNIEKLIDPVLLKLKRSPTNNENELDLLKHQLRQLTSPFSDKLTHQYRNLTLTEVRVANMIRHGKSTKEIAEVMSISTRTVDAHRRGIRKKLGIKKKKVNLMSYLTSLN